MEKHVMGSVTHDKNTPAYAGYPPLTIRLRPALELGYDQLLELSSINRDLRLELTAKGELIVTPPVGGETSNRNSEINMQLRLWAKRAGTGVAFDSSGGFILPNGAVRSPDASWVERPCLETPSAEQCEKFLPPCPDFVIELRSPTDSLSVLRDKMREYVSNGARLGWLIEPRHKRVYVYRPEARVQELEAPEEIPGDPVLPGFVLNLREVW
jgi:Uma2 family endonuclease